MQGYECWTCRRQSTKELMFWNLVLEKTLESPLESKIKLVNIKGNQPWMLFGRTNVEAEAPILWPHDANSWLTGKDLDAGKTESRKWKGQQRMRLLMASPTQWAWIWANSGRQWGTGKTGLLQPMGSWKVRQDLVTEQQQSRVIMYNFVIFLSQFWTKNLNRM